MSEKFSVYLLVPGEEGQVVNIEGDDKTILKQMQGLVGGYIEMLRLPNKPEIACVMNETGSFDQEKNRPNFSWRQSGDLTKTVMFQSDENYIYGSVFFTRLEKGVNKSLTDEDIEYVKHFTAKRA